MRYRRRTWEIDVVQWNGDNRSEIEELAGKSIGKYEEAMAGEIDYLPPAGWYAVKDRGRFLIWSPAVLNQEFEPIPEELPQVGELMGHNPGTGVPDPWLGAVCTSCGKHTGAFMGSIDGKLNCYECFVKDIPAPIGASKERRCKDCSKELMGGASVVYRNAEHCMDCYSKIAEETLCQ